MTRNQLLIILIPVLFLTYLFFSRDRDEEMRKARAKHPTDLVSRIMQHNAQNPGGSFGDGGNLGGDNSFNPNRGYTPAPAVLPPKRQVPLQDDYYPPTPHNNKAIGPQSRVWPVPPDIRPIFLTDGRPVAFQGEKVFYVTKDGMGELVKDGYYSVFNGKMVMVVRDGKKIIN